jgi:hypothetical protein
VLGAIAIISLGSGRPEIEAVLAQDTALSVQRDQYIQTGYPPANVATWYTQQLRAIDTRSCPRDFRDAFMRHGDAWEGFAAQLAQQPQGTVDALWMGFVNSLGGELDGGTRRLTDVHNASADAVRRSWQEVRHVAADHDVIVP